MATKRNMRRRPRQLISLLGPGNYHRIARGSGYTPQYISRVLRGKIGVRFHGAAVIAEAAGVTLDELWNFISQEAA